MTSDSRGQDRGGAYGSESRLTLSVAGDVQGVGFRWWVRERAVALGLRGSASNLDDGSVQIVLEGTRSHCADVMAQVRGGSTPGQVRSAVHRWEGCTGMTSFTVD